MIKKRLDLTLKDLDVQYFSDSNIIAFKMKNQLYNLTNKYKVQRFIGEINTF